MEHLLENAEDEMVKHELRLAIMDERMKREECILATSPHRVVANAVRYARAMNYSLSSRLEKRIKLLHDEFEQEYRRITDVQQEAYKDSSHYPPRVGYTRKQFRSHLGEVLTNKRRDDELRRAKTQLSLPSMSSARLSGQPTPPSKSRITKIAWQSTTKDDGMDAGANANPYMTISSWKHDGDAVYLPPI